MDNCLKRLNVRAKLKCLTEYLSRVHIYKLLFQFLRMQQESNGKIPLMRRPLTASNNWSGCVEHITPPGNKDQFMEFQVVAETVMCPGSRVRAQIYAREGG